MNKHRGKNEGSLSQRKNGSWRAQVTLEGRRVSKGFKTKAEAQKWLQDMRNQIDDGLTFDATRITLEQFLTGWLETVKTSLRPKPALQYTNLTNRYLIPQMGKIKLQELRPDRIDRFYAELVEQGVGVRTVRYIHSVLHRAMEQAARSSYIPRNPAHGATLPRVPQVEMQYLDEDQVLQFLIAAQESRFYALYQLAIKTGMRQGELLGLKWQDISWRKGTLTVKRQVQRVPGQGFVFGEPKTKAGNRSIKLGEATLQALREHSQRQQVDRAAAGSQWQDLDLVFPSKVGTPMDQRNLLNDFYAVLARAGLHRIRFHDLRHTAASLMINNNIAINRVSQVLGHSKPSVTLDIYSHVFAGSQDDIAALMDEIVTPIPVSMTNVKEPRFEKVGRNS